MATTTVAACFVLSCIVLPEAIQSLDIASFKFLSPDDDKEEDYP